MTNKEVGQKLSSDRTLENVRRVIKSMLDDIVNNTKDQMRFDEQWVEKDATLTEKKARIQTNVEYRKH